MGLNRYDEAKACYEKGVTLNPEAMLLHYGRYVLALMEGDTVTMQGHADWAKGKPQEHWLAAEEAQAASCSGKMRLARQLCQRAVDLALRHNSNKKFLLTTYKKQTTPFQNPPSLFL